jgi:cytochrome c-type biogenesis protein CcmH
MIFWSIAIAITALACAAMFYAAAGRKVNAAGPVSADANSHFKDLLASIDLDLANGKLAPDQALAARAELARELLRSRGDARGAAGEIGKGTVLAGLGLVAVLSLGLYAVLGHPDMPAQPLAGRPEVAAQNLDLDTAIAQIEARLATTPDDARGWSVIAPAYIELGRYDDAVTAFRRVIALSGATAERQTDLAEALLLAAGETGSDEALAHLSEAADTNSEDVRSRLYLASELMRLERYDEAATRWQQALDLASGNEPWLTAARQGLAVAQKDGAGATAEDQEAMIAGMVQSLESRLATQGGPVEEWTQLVRSYLVLGDVEAAQAAYDQAVAAYPAAFDRGELDTIALGAGLTLKGETP